MTQDSYARLLKGIDLGVAVYFPSRDIKIWDVAYFTGSTHHRLFNVFEIDREESERMRFALPNVRNSSSTTQFHCQTFTSGISMEKKFNAQGEATLHGIGTLDLKVRRSDKSTEVAMCIPSEPMEVVTLTDDWALRQWWENWRHNIALAFGHVNHASPLFLVLEKTDTPQVANCYYNGEESETNLRVSGAITDLTRMSMEAGFSCNEIGNFGFKTACHALDGKMWSIFIRTEKLASILFKNKLCKKRYFIKRPNWSQPGQTPKPQGSSQGQKSSGDCVRSMKLSETLTLVSTPNGEYYAEFHGTNLPDEVIHGECEEYAANMLLAFVIETEIVTNALYHYKAFQPSQIGMDSKTTVDLEGYHRADKGFGATFTRLSIKETA